MSAMVHAQGRCRVCTNGELVFSVLTANSRVIVECLECLTGYLDPRDLVGSATIRMEEVDACAATIGDVERGDVADLIMN